MSELRYDPLGGYWVNIAAIRAERPNEFRRVESRRPDAICPFCAGQESQTPPAVLELTAGNGRTGLGAQRTGGGSSDWIVRVVPNKYPAFAFDAHPTREAIGPYTRIRGGGIQEIIIESPRHVTSLSQLTDDELRLTFRAFQLRIQAASESENTRQVTLFRNCRSEAGASIEHAHSQIVASPLLADSLAARFERSARAQRETGAALLESMVAFEERQGLRIVKLSPGFVAFCPFASRFAFQIWIAARARGVAFERLLPDDLDEVARLVRWCTERLERTLDAPPYNWILHLPPQFPGGGVAQALFPWFIELIPRLGRLAGYELADGGWINDWPPEFAAAKLRAD